MNMQYNIKSLVTVKLQLVNQVLTLTYEFTTGNADDYYIIMGLYGRGVLIVDDISVTKK